MKQDQTRNSLNITSETKPNKKATEYLTEGTIHLPALVVRKPISANALLNRPNPRNTFILHGRKCSFRIQNYINKAPRLLCQRPVA